MKHLKLSSKIIAGLLTLCIIFAAHSAFAATPCKSSDPGYPSQGTFLGLVPWYQYLRDDFTEVQPPGGSATCGFHVSFNTTTSNDQTVTGVNGGTNGLGVIWLIGLAIFEDLLRVAGIIAVGFVVYGGIRYITSQGEPQDTAAAQGTVLNSLIGLAITIIAAGLVSFIGSSLGGGNPTSTSAVANPFPQVSASPSLLTVILNIVFSISGALSLLFVVIGGFRYVISQGDSQNTAKAKNTIIYAAIGLAITLVAASIVNFVVGHL